MAWSPLLYSGMTRANASERSTIALQSQLCWCAHANTYDVTPDGLKLAIFYTKVHDRVLAPLFVADQPPAPP